MTNASDPAAAASRQPTFYIPHGGGPCFFMGEDQKSPPPMWQEMADFLADFIRSLPERPKALLIVSAHWEEAEFTVHAGTKPDLYYDYYGFPEHTYHLRWDAPGAPDLSHRVKALLEGTGIAAAVEVERGWDHGVFIPMMVAVPEADIPTVQLSLRTGLDPAEHIALGRALEPLRAEGVLIIGSGMSFHNMQVRDGSGMPLARQFDAWLTDAVTDADPARRDAALADWEAGPAARFAHPREEHLIPLMVAAGAAGADKGSLVYQDTVIGWAISGYRFGNS